MVDSPALSDHRPWLVIVDDDCDRGLLRKAARAFANGARSEGSGEHSQSLIHRATCWSTPNRYAILELATFAAPIDHEDLSSKAGRILDLAAISTVQDDELAHWIETCVALATHAALSHDPIACPETRDRFGSLTFATPCSPHIALRQDKLDPTTYAPLPAITADHETIERWTKGAAPIILITKALETAKGISIQASALSRMSNEYHSTNAIERLRLAARFEPRELVP